MKELTGEKMSQLIDLAEYDPRLVLDVRYATTNNFLGVALYDSPRIFLIEAVAKKLSAAQDRLEKKGLGLKVYDGYRPMSVQKALWDLLPDPRYVADPKVGSNHNRGAAVDVTLVDLETGEELVMPSEFDEFTEKAHSDFYDLPQEAIDNRAILKEAMVGFTQLPTEWWHFDDKSGKKYPILDVPISELSTSELLS
ncbi:MAG: M15 family metallopeptidase [Simkaniaceae bacterium]|nr:M15 family metallopeptidase [Simkaniaceae bacterium]